MFAQQFHSPVCITVIHNRTVVATQHDQGVFGNTGFFECAHYFAYSPVELQQSVATRAHAALSDKTGMRPTGNVRVIGSDIQEERFIFVVFNKSDSFASDAVCNVFIFPQGLLAPFHVADTRNAVHNRQIMPMVRTRFQFGKQFRMVFSQRFARERFFIAHFNRIIRIKIDDPLILNPHTRHTIACGSHYIGIVEPYI